MLQLRATLDKLVQQRKYVEAEDVRKQLKGLEVSDVKKCEAELNDALKRKLKAFMCETNKNNNSNIDHT